MKKIKKNIKKILQFIKNNIFVISFIGIIFFVFIVVIVKSMISKPNYVYAKIKISQGLWWANTTKPSIWLAQGINKGDIEKSLTGKPLVEVIEVRQYPWWESDEYLVYITAKLEVSKNKKTGKYNFKRSTIAIGSPIDLEFPDTQTSGTITALSEKPFNDQKQIKEIAITKRWAEPWEFEAINIGDKYNDGEDDAFEIIDKEETFAKGVYANGGNNYPIYSEPKVHIVVKLKMNLTDKNGSLVYGGDQILRLGKSLNISTKNYTFNDYLVSKIEESR